MRATTHQVCLLRLRVQKHHAEAQAAVVVELRLVLAASEAGRAELHAALLQRRLRHARIVSAVHACVHTRETVLALSAHRDALDGLKRSLLALRRRRRRLSRRGRGGSQPLQLAVRRLACETVRRGVSAKG